MSTLDAFYERFDCNMIPHRIVGNFSLRGGSLPRHAERRRASRRLLSG